MKDQNLKYFLPPRLPFGPIIETLVCLLVYLMISLVVMIGCTGCKNTSPTSVIYRAEGTTTLSVDAAMKGWSDWVAQGFATSNQVQTVHDAYNKYYASQMVAKAAVDDWIAAKTPAASNNVISATQAVSESSKAILDLVQQFTAKK